MKPLRQIQNEAMLDRICSQITEADTLNALHACRPGHPLNNKFQWRNAYALICQRPSYEVDGDVVAWLEKQAQKEAA